MPRLAFAGLLISVLYAANFGETSDEWPTIIDPDAYRDVPQIIASRGFIPEVHKVVTKDGYILTIHRIVNPIASRASLRPVMLLHGLLSSSAFYVYQAPLNISDNPHQHENSLAFGLARRDFDVWLPNLRGNTYSAAHISLKTSGKLCC